MKARIKLVAYTAVVSMLFQLGGGCGTFWGDLIGDIIWLRAVD